jgi:hypothetical protein
MNIHKLPKKIYWLAIVIACFFVSARIYADIVINETEGKSNVSTGYIENTDISFTFVTGVSKQDTNIRPMSRIDLVFNGIKIIEQRSSDKELYIKATDSGGNIVALRDTDKTIIKQAMNNLYIQGTNNTDKLVYKEIESLLNLLDSWPETLPVLIWQDNNTRLFADQSGVLQQKIDRSGHGGRKSIKPSDIFDASSLQPPTPIRLQNWTHGIRLESAFHLAR